MSSSRSISPRVHVSCPSRGWWCGLPLALALGLSVSACRADGNTPPLYTESSPPQPDEGAGASA